MTTKAEPITPNTPGPVREYSKLRFNLHSAKVCETLNLAFHITVLVAIQYMYKLLFAYFAKNEQYNVFKQLFGTVHNVLVRYRWHAIYLLLQCKLVQKEALIRGQWWGVLICSMLILLQSLNHYPTEYNLKLRNILAIAYFTNMLFGACWYIFLSVAGLINHPLLNKVLPAVYEIVTIDEP